MTYRSDSRGVAVNGLLGLGQVLVRVLCILPQTVSLREDITTYNFTSTAKISGHKMRPSVLLPTVSLGRHLWKKICRNGCVGMWENVSVEHQWLSWLNKTTEAIIPIRLFHFKHLIYNLIFFQSLKLCIALLGLLSTI